MPRTFGPDGVDEVVMDVLLGVVDDPLNIIRGVTGELPKSESVVECQVVVLSSDRRMKVVNKETDDPFLVSIGYGHFSVGPSNGRGSPAAASRMFQPTRSCTAPTGAAAC